MTKPRFKGWRNRPHPLLEGKEFVPAFRIYYSLLLGHKLFSFLPHAKFSNPHPSLSAHPTYRIRLEACDRLISSHQDVNEAPQIQLLG